MSLHKVLLFAAWMSMAATACAAQTAPLAQRPLSKGADTDLSFEVATVKPSTLSPIYHPNDGRHFYLTAKTLKDLVLYAYNLHPKQLESGPDWTDKEKFDIAGVVNSPTEPTVPQWRVMLGKLLAQRFQLKLHTEKRELPVFVLSVAKGGPKLTPNTSGVNMGLSMEAGKDVNLAARNETMAGFCAAIGAVLVDRPVLDETGINGGFDFTLHFSTDGLRFGKVILPSSDSDTAANFFTAVQDLGLRLDAAKRPVDVYIIDTVEHPTEN